MYSQAVPVPSTSISPKVSITVPLKKSSMASSPLIEAAPVVKVGAKPKKAVKPGASEAM